MEEGQHGHLLMLGTEASHHLYCGEYRVYVQWVASDCEQRQLATKPEKQKSIR